MFTNQPTKNIEYLLALHSIDGLGPIRLKKVLDFFGDPKIAWSASKSEFLKIGIPQKTWELLHETRNKLDPFAYMDSVKRAGISWITLFDNNYPESLKEIYDPPVVLYFKGHIKPEDHNAIAIVGTRKITGYGKAVTEKFSKELAQTGFTIVSGLARGVDTEAHKSALEANGRTLSILGSGLNNIYPPENQVLVDQIIRGNGAVVSELPPDYQSLPGNFPARNRIIAGLSIAILVTEAAEDSGSLITARLAAEQGKDVFAVPGPITSYLSKGCAKLIQDGAKLVTSVDEILEEMGMEHTRSRKSEVGNQTLENLSEIEKQILKILENEQKHVDEIVREAKLPSSEVMSSLIKMEISGLVKNLSGGNYMKNL